MKTPLSTLRLPRDRRARPLLAELISPALQAFCDERGFAELDLPELCARAGISEAEFARSYADLEDCFCAVLEIMREEFVVEVASAVLPQTDWRRQMRAAAYAMLGFWTADLPRARFMLVHAFAAGERASLIRDEGMQMMVALIDAGRQEPQAASNVTRATAEALAGSTYSQMQALAVEERDPEEYRLRVPELLHGVLLPYLGPEIAAQELAIEPPPLAYESLPSSPGAGISSSSAAASGPR